MGLLAFSISISYLFLVTHYCYLSGILFDSPGLFKGQIISDFGYSRLFSFLGFSSSFVFALWVTFSNRLFLTVGELMSLAVGAVSSSKNMGFEELKEGEEESGNSLETAATNPEDNDEVGEKLGRQMSEASLYATEEEEEDDERDLELGPQCTLKEQLERDKDDESLRRWKEQLLGSVDFNNVGETLEPDVKILSLSILSPGRPDIVLPIPDSGNPKGLWFTLKEGSRYALRFNFQVSKNIVSGLKYSNSVWKTGVKVDSTKEMLGTFSPQPEPYTHEIHEETTPSGIFARGSYSARSKFVDDDNKCYLEINYTFDIRKEWASA